MIIWKQGKKPTFRRNYSFSSLTIVKSAWITQPCHLNKLLLNTRVHWFHLKIFLYYTVSSSFVTVNIKKYCFRWRKEQSKHEDLEQRSPGLLFTNYSKFVYSTNKMLKSLSPSISIVWIPLSHEKLILQPFKWSYLISLISLAVWNRDKLQFINACSYSLNNFKNNVGHRHHTCNRKKAAELKRFSLHTCIGVFDSSVNWNDELCLPSLPVCLHFIWFKAQYQL